MKAKKIIAGMTTAAIAASMMAISASANFTVVDGMADIKQIWNDKGLAGYNFSASDIKYLYFEAESDHLDWWDNNGTPSAVILKTDGTGDGFGGVAALNYGSDWNEEAQTGDKTWNQDNTYSNDNCVVDTKGTEDKSDDVYSWKFDISGHYTDANFKEDAEGLKYWAQVNFQCWWGGDDESVEVKFTNVKLLTEDGLDILSYPEAKAAVDDFGDVVGTNTTDVTNATTDLIDAIDNATTIEELEAAIKAAEDALKNADKAVDDGYKAASDVIDYSESPLMDNLDDTESDYNKAANALDDQIEKAKAKVEKMKREEAAADALDELKDALEEANIEGVIEDMEGAADALNDVTKILEEAAAAADKIDALKDVLAKAQEAFDALEEGDEADTEAFEAAKDAIGQAAAKLAAAEEALNDARANYDAATQKEIDELNNKIKELEDAAEKDATTIADLEKENDLLDGQVEQLTKDKEDAAEFINEKQAKIDELEAQVEDLKKQLEEAKANNADPEEIQKLKDEIAAKDAEIADLKKQLDDANAAKEAAQKEADDAKKAAEEAKKGSNPGTGAAAFAVAGLALAGAAFVVTKKRK